MTKFKTFIGAMTVAGMLAGCPGPGGGDNPIGCAHMNGITVVTKPATCIEEGSADLICSDCGATGSIAIPVNKNNHTNLVTSGTPATCTSAGSGIQDCLDCGDQKSGTLPKLPHPYGTAVLTAPSCTENGKVVATCTVCGHEDVAIPVELFALGHDWGNWTPPSPAAATCTEPGGVQTKTCSNPLHDETRDHIAKTLTQQLQSDALGHNKPLGKNPSCPHDECTIHPNVWGGQNLVGAQNHTIVGTHKTASEQAVTSAPLSPATPKNIALITLWTQ